MGSSDVGPDVLCVHSDNEVSLALNKTFCTVKYVFDDTGVISNSTESECKYMHFIPIRLLVLD